MAGFEECPKCNGVGTIQDEPNQFEICQRCEGKGKIDGKLVSIHARNVDPFLRRRFKSWCAEKELTMQDAVIMLIEEAINKETVA